MFPRSFCSTEKFGRVFGGGTSMSTSRSTLSRLSLGTLAIAAIALGACSSLPPWPWTKSEAAAPGDQEASAAPDGLENIAPQAGTPAGATATAGPTTTQVVAAP